jgi:uncharacterized protein YndB with AHSA1/START domain
MATTTNSATVTLPTDTEILITRQFDAPKDLVWKAYTTPELIKRWWGGSHGTVTSAEALSACCSSESRGCGRSAPACCWCASRAAD